MLPLVEALVRYASWSSAPVVLVVLLGTLRASAHRLKQSGFELAKRGGLHSPACGAGGGCHLGLGLAVIPVARRLRRK